MGCKQIKVSSVSSPKVVPMVETPTKTPPTFPTEPKTASQRKEMDQINAEFASEV